MGRKIKKIVTYVVSGSKPQSSRLNRRHNLHFRLHFSIVNLISSTKQLKNPPNEDAGGGGNLPVACIHQEKEEEEEHVNDIDLSNGTIR